jgi:hypothetical protein
MSNRESVPLPVATPVARFTFTGFVARKSESFPKK